MSEDDRGSVTIWVLGLAMLLLVFGGLALDYWRALALQRELAAVADSAAVAAASGIDEAFYRETGSVVLELDRSRGEVELGLLGVFVDQSEPVTVRASATAAPVLVP
jgi:uncharacterized membrane protein